MSLIFGSQSLASLIHDQFYGEQIACDIQAISSVSAIQVQILSTTIMSVKAYFEVVYQIKVSERKAILTSAILWVFCVSITLVTSQKFPAALVRDGTYCLFEFSSPAIACWLLPGFGLAVITMVIAYWGIVRFIRNRGNDEAQLNVPTPFPPTPPGGALSTS